MLGRRARPEGGERAVGLVSDYVVKLVARQVDEYGLVVWFDADRIYEGLIPQLSLPDVTVVTYQGSFYALRREVEPILERLEAPRLVVYVPMAENQTHGALTELATLGTVLQPGQQPWQRNTRLSVIARAALRPVLPPEELAQVERDVEAGRLSLADLDQLETEVTEAPSVIRAIFGTTNPQEVAVAFLASEKHDAALVQRRAMPELVGLLKATFGGDLSEEATPEDSRDAFARHLIVTEFLGSLGGEPPPQLAQLRGASSPRPRDACVQLVKTWRLRRDLAQSYGVYADRVERALGLGSIPFTLEHLRTCESFAATERALQRLVEESLLHQPREELLRIARERQQGYWPEQRPELRARWAVMAAAGELLEEAERVESELGTAENDPRALALAYTGGSSPWCDLDRLHRRLEQLYHAFQYQGGGDLDALETLVDRARRRYTDVAGELARRFAEALSASDFRIDGILRQSEIWGAAVARAVREGRTAYLLIDALRYEMARELASSLSQSHDVSLNMALATAPSITDVGMAALLPGAQNGLGLARGRGGRLAVRVGETWLHGHKDRMGLLRTHAPLAASGQLASICHARLDALCPPSRGLRKAIAAADLVVVTSQDVDELGETASITLARRTMEDVLSQIFRAVHVLAELGCQTIVITADHGFLFGEEAGSEMKVDPPGGDTVVLRRRVWIGKGGSSDPSILRVPLTRLGVESDLEIAVPWGLGVFRAGGSLAYHHGGLSPQELLIPVLVVSVRSGAGVAPSAGEIEWELATGSAKITTAYFTVRVGGRVAGLFGLELPRVRVEIHLVAEPGAGGARVISSPVAATYGYDQATGDVQLRPQADDPQAIEPNTVTLAITERVARGRAFVLLLDATTGRELARLADVEVTISL